MATLLLLPACLAGLVCAPRGAICHPPATPHPRVLHPAAPPLPRQGHASACWLLVGLSTCSLPPRPLRSCTQVLNPEQWWYSAGMPENLPKFDGQPTNLGEPRPSRLSLLHAASVSCNVTQYVGGLHD